MVLLEKMEINMKKIIISVVVILFLFFCGLIAFYLLNVNATFGKNEEVIVEIEKGSSSNKIGMIVFYD